MTRKATIATVSLDLPGGKPTVQDNVRRALAAIDEAGRFGADIICLPEMYATLGCTDYQDALHQAVDMQGSISEQISAKAASLKCYIISNTVEQDGDALYNTATLFDRSGAIVGSYRKTHLAPGEETTFAQGDAFPVFELDFGKVGLMICMDIHFPEIARIYALQGVDILFWPTMSYGPTGEFLEVLFRSRAMDNQIYCVTANFCQQPYLAGKAMGRAYIVGPDGKIRADTGHRAGIAVAAVDLDEGYEHWVMRADMLTLKDAMLGGRRPALYGALVQPDSPAPPWRIANPKLSAATRDMLTPRSDRESAE